jgi:hypothetical protein
VWDPHVVALLHWGFAYLFVVSWLFGYVYSRPVYPPDHPDGNRDPAVNAHLEIPLRWPSRSP